MTRDFVLGTIMRPPHPLEAWNTGAAQSWWHGVMIASDQKETPPERVVPKLAGKEDTLSDQYSLQSAGSFMTHKLLDRLNKNAP